MAHAHVHSSIQAMACHCRRTPVHSLGSPAPRLSCPLAKRLCPEELLCVEGPCRLEPFHVDLGASRVIVQGDAALGEGIELARPESALDEPLHRLRRQREEVLDACRRRRALEKAEHGIATALPAVAALDHEAADLGVRLRVALELCARDHDVVARVHIVEAHVHVARQHLGRPLHEYTPYLKRLDELEDAGNVGGRRQVDTIVDVACDERAAAVGRVKLLDERTRHRRQQVAACDTLLECLYAVACKVEDAAGAAGLERSTHVRCVGVGVGDMLGGAVGVVGGVSEGRRGGGGRRLGGGPGSGAGDLEHVALLLFAHVLEKRARLGQPQRVDRLVRHAIGGLNQSRRRQVDELGCAERRRHRRHEMLRAHVEHGARR
mmetsp:Transcript_35183/g.92342  ORF Transcript_35183/g.92342 Transcript_35183/m.92342 type:complete len:378 (-) Transcript_35183:108-1241(-)